MDPTADAILTDIYSAEQGGRAMALPILPGKRENLAGKRIHSFYLRRLEEKGKRVEMNLDDAVKEYQAGACVILLEE